MRVKSPTLFPCWRPFWEQKHTSLNSGSGPVSSTSSVRRASLTLTHRRSAFGAGCSLLAPLVEQRVAGGVQVFDLHLVVVHTHGRQGAGHLLLGGDEHRFQSWWWKWQFDIVVDGGTQEVRAASDSCRGYWRGFIAQQQKVVFLQTATCSQKASLLWWREEQQQQTAAVYKSHCWSCLSFWYILNDLLLFGLVNVSLVFATFCHTHIIWTYVFSVYLHAEGSKDKEKAALPKLLTSSVSGSTTRRGQHWEGLCFLLFWTRLREATAACLCSSTYQWNKKMTKTSILCLNVWLPAEIHSAAALVAIWFAIDSFDWPIVCSVWLLSTRANNRTNDHNNTLRPAGMSGMFALNTTFSPVMLRYHLGAEQVDCAGRSAPVMSSKWGRAALCTSML